MRPMRVAATLLSSCVLATPLAAKDSWVEVRTAHFRVLSDADAKDVRRLASELEIDPSTNTTGGSRSEGSDPHGVVRGRTSPR